MEGAGEVELAGSIGEDGAEAVSRDRVADLRRGRTGWVLCLGEATVLLGGRDRRLGAVGDGGDLAGQPRWEQGRVGGDLLFCVPPGQAQVEGGVGAGVGVQGAAFGLGGEGRGSLWAGGAF